MAQMLVLYAKVDLKDLGCASSGIWLHVGQELGLMALHERGEAGLIQGSVALS